MVVRRVLIVDDEASITRGLQRYLERAGAYHVRTENESHRVIQTTKDFRPDLVLLDIVMPGTDGTALAAAFRQDPSLARVPIVFLTALVSRGEVSGYEKIGGYTFLAKPVDPDEVISCIEHTLARPSDALFRS